MGRKSTVTQVITEIAEMLGNGSINIEDDLEMHQQITYLFDIAYECADKAVVNDKRKAKQNNNNDHILSSALSPKHRIEYFPQNGRITDENPGLFINGTDIGITVQGKWSRIDESAFTMIETACASKCKTKKGGNSTLRLTFPLLHELEYEEIPYPPPHTKPPEGFIKQLPKHLQRHWDTRLVKSYIDKRLHGSATYSEEPEPLEYWNRRIQISAIAAVNLVRYQQAFEDAVFEPLLKDRLIDETLKIIRWNHYFIFGQSNVRAIELGLPRVWSDGSIWFPIENRGSVLVSSNSSTTMHHSLAPLKNILDIHLIPTSKSVNQDIHRFLYDGTNQGTGSNIFVWTNISPSFFPSPRKDGLNSIVSAHVSISHPNDTPMNIDCVYSPYISAQDDTNYIRIAIANDIPFYLLLYSEHRNGKNLIRNLSVDAYIKTLFSQIPELNNVRLDECSQDNYHRNHTHEMMSSSSVNSN